jgi:microcin C transport system permease protein
LLIVLLGPGGLGWFPIQGLKSELYEVLSPTGQILDRIHHAILPLFCYCIGSFATLTMLMKNSMLEEIKKDYARTARAKGLDEKTVLVRHVLRNALLPVATGLGSLLGVFFAGALLLETIFNLDGIGLLSYNAVLQRDFNVVMGLLMLQSFASLAGNLVSDIIYVFVDPRIDYGAESA